MNKNQFIKIVSKQIHFFFDRSQITEELECHIQDSMLDLISEGVSQEEAEQEAISRMGNPVEIGKALNKEHHPMIGYLWLASCGMMIIVCAVSLISLLSVGYGLFHMMTPVTIQGCIVQVPIEMRVELPTHSIDLDMFCLNENNELNITYRTWKKYSYSRVNWSFEPFSIYNQEKDYLSGSGFSSHNLLGSYGYRKIRDQKTDTIVLVFRDGQRVILNTKEYGLE